MATATNEVGISPVLLQAITHTLASNIIKREQSDVGGGGVVVHSGDQSSAEAARPRKIIISKDYSSKPIIKVEGGSHVIHGLGQQGLGHVSALQDAIFVVQNPVDRGLLEQVEEQEQEKENEVEQSNGVAQEYIVNPKSETEYVIAHSQSTEEILQGNGNSIYKINSLGSGISVLSGFSSQLKASRKDSSVSSADDRELSENGHSLLESDAQDHNAHVPSPVHDIMVSELESVVTETVVHSASHTDFAENVVQTVSSDREDSDGGSSPKKFRVIEVPEMPTNIANGTTIYLNTGDGTGGMLLRAETTEDGTIIYKPVGMKAISTLTGSPSVSSHGVIPMNMFEEKGPCPICTDRISGYHYGIYTCESCKGFFKRTVQNKKSFICHRKGDCDINIANRKKCPACRFNRCLMVGMKLEAIRGDRMRGGRSSYDGCSPHGRLPLSKSPKEPIRRVAHAASPTTPSAKPVVVVSSPTPTSSSGLVRSIHMMATPVAKPQSAPTSLSAALTGGISLHRTSSVVVEPSQLDPVAQDDGSAGLDLSSQIQPHTPQFLEDLMAVESLMNDDDGEQPCCEGKLTPGDPNPFGSLLHMADHCLYRIVRWARNLPDFAGVPTDDQILLLQNCWAELLCVCVSWNSLHAEGHLRLSHGRTLDVEGAKEMGLAEVVQRLLDFTANLRRLEVDNYEFVALKVMLLLSPDVNNLKDESSIRFHQERLVDALLTYSSTHYVERPSKFSQMLTFLPELTRTCCLGKDQLSQRQAAGDVPQYSLLSELLKGDISVQS